MFGLLSRFLMLSTVLVLGACSTFKPQHLDYSRVQVAPQKAMDYGVYTPPGWTAEESLPLIVLLHGGGDNHTSFEKYGAHQYFDQQISAGAMPRVVIVTPNGRFGFWENWSDGSYLYRDWILDKVMPVVQKDYNTLNCPEHCHLAGISMGGFGVLRFAYFAHDRFSSVSAISAAIMPKSREENKKIPFLFRLFFPVERIFGESFKENYDIETPFYAWVNKPELRRLRLQLIWGDKDHKRIIRNNQALHQHLLENNVEHDVYVYQGNHKWVSWIPNFNRVVRFLVLEQ